MVMSICLALGLWSAFEGGIFKAFSEFVMKGLANANPSSGIEVMQNINQTVLKTEFVASLFGITIFSITFAAYSFFVVEGWALVLIVAAAPTYVLSVFLVTIFGNVPMNNKLADLGHQSDQGVSYWSIYTRNWTRLNHLRTLGSFLTAMIYLMAAAFLMSTP